MKRIVDVTLINKEQGDQQIPCRFEADGQIYLLTAIDKLEVFKRGTPDQEMPPEITITLGKKKSHIRYEYDDSENASQQDHDIREVVNLFWSRYPLSIVNGKSVPKYTKAAQLDVVDLYHRSVADYDRFKLMTDTAVFIETLDIATLRDIAYYYGLRPNVGMQRNDIILLLANFKTGLLHNEIEDGVSKFLSIWKDAENTDNRDMEVIVRKAIEYGIIQVRTENSMVYYYLDTARMGSSVLDVMDYFRRDMRHYEDNVKRTVEEADIKDQIRLEEETKYINDFQSKIDAENGGFEEVLDLKQKAYDLIAKGKISRDFNPESATIADLKREINLSSSKKKRTIEV